MTACVHHLFASSQRLVVTCSYHGSEISLKPPKNTATQMLPQIQASGPSKPAVNILPAPRRERELLRQRVSRSAAELKPESSQNSTFETLLAIFW